MRGEEGIKEFSVPYKDTQLNICVVSGLANARKVMDKVRSGEANYHLIEVMACRRGCIMEADSRPGQDPELRRRERGDFTTRIIP